MLIGNGTFRLVRKKNLPKIMYRLVFISLSDFSVGNSNMNWLRNELSNAVKLIRESLLLGHEID